MFRTALTLSCLLLSTTALADTAVRECDDLVIAGLDMPPALECVSLFTDCWSVELMNGCDHPVTIREGEAPATRDEVQVLPSNEWMWLGASDTPIVVGADRGLHEGRFTIVDASLASAGDTFGQGSHGCSTSPGLSWMGLIALLAVRRLRD